MTYDALLVFPPMFAFDNPYLALPSLKAYAEKYGYKIYVYDANIIVNDVLFSKRFLERCYLKYQERYTPTSIADMDIEELIDTIDEAKQVLRSEEFFDIESYINASLIIQQSIKFVNKAYSESGGLLLERFGSKYQRDSNSVIKLIKNRNTVYDYIYDNYIIPEITKIQTKVIGISITSSDQIIPALILARKLKETDKQYILIVGGNMVTHLHRNENFLKLLSFVGIDLAVIFEGELAFTRLLEMFSKAGELFSKPQLEGIPNIIYRDGSCWKTSRIIKFLDINELPPPNFDDLPLDKYFTPYIVFPLLTSRGCYWRKCVFCDIHYGYGPIFRQRSVENVINDILYLKKKYGAKYIAFQDCAMGPAYMHKLSQALIRSSLNIETYVDIRAERQFTYDTFRLAREAGFRMLCVGIESYNQRILDSMNKGTDLNTIQNIIRMIKMAGIWVHVYIMIGFPGETKDEVHNTIKFIFDNIDYIDSLECSAFHLLENSPIILNQLDHKYGIIKKWRDGDISLVYNYILENGLQQKDAESMVNNFISLLKRRMPSYIVWGFQPFNYTLLYISKYGVEKIRNLNII